MGRREQLIGLLVVAAIVAAVYFSGQAGCPFARQCAVDGAPDTAPLPNLSQADVQLAGDDVVVRVEAPSRPILAFEENLLLFHFADTQTGADAVVTEASISFTMKMEMGKNKYLLVPADRPGWLQARFVLPACPSGGRRWFGIVRFQVDGREQQERFQFDLEPGSKSDTGTATGAF